MNDIQQPPSSDERQPTEGEARDRLGPAIDFLRLLWAVDHELNSASKRMETVLGVTGPQRLVLRFVSTFPSVSAGRIASFLHLHPSTLTGVLRRLEERGFVSRHLDPADARRALFRVTAKAKKVLQPNSGHLERSISDALDRRPELVGPARELLSELANALGSAARDE